MIYQNFIILHQQGRNKGRDNPLKDSFSLVLVLKQYSFVFVLFCFLSWFGFILLFLAGDMVFFSRKRRTGLTCDLSGRLVLWLALFLLQRCILQGLSARCWQNSYRNKETLQTPILLKGETALYQGKAHNHCLNSWAR